MIDIMTGQNLADFRLADKYLQDLETKDLKTVTITSVPEMKLLKMIGDDEGVQHKAFNFAFERLSIRGMAESECSHPAWNSFKKSLTAAGLTMDIMKLSICNFDHGAYKSGDKLEMKQDAFALFLSEQEDAYFQSFQERVAADRNEPYEPDMQAGDTMQDWLQTKALQNRGLYDRYGPDDGPEPGDAEEAEERAPNSKSELYEIFGKKGPIHMVAGFMADRSLQETARLVVEIAQPLEQAYHDTNTLLQEGWQQQMCFASERALGEYVRTVVRVLWTLQKPKLHDSLQMTTKASRTAVPDEVPAWAQHEQQLLQTCVTFAVALASNVLWSNLHHWMSFPHILAGLLVGDKKTRDEVLRHARSIAETVVAAESHAESAGGVEWKEIFVDLWNRQPLAREAMALVLQGETRSLLQLARRLYQGTPSTKDILENCFAFLHRKATVHSTNFKMSDACKYLYAIGSPYSTTGGVPQIKPDKKDFATMLSPMGLPDREMANKRMFATRATLPKPEVLPRPAGIFHQKWKNSGPLAQQRAAAAISFLCEDKAKSWANIDLCFLGSLFVSGCIFVHTEANEYVLSLGFRKWAAVGWPLKVKFMHCFELRGPWRMVPTQPLLRAFTPLELNSPFAWMICGPPEPLLEAALKKGVSIVVPHLKQICAMLGVEIPRTGGGKGGRVLKVDIAGALISALFTNASEDERKRMISAICGNSQKAPKESEREVLDVVAQLAEEDP
eukprot:s155_g5.t1